MDSKYIESEITIIKADIDTLRNTLIKHGISHFVWEQPLNSLAVNAIDMLNVLDTRLSALENQCIDLKKETDNKILELLEQIRDLQKSML